MAVEPQQIRPPNRTESSSSALVLEQLKPSIVARLQSLLNRENIFAYILLVPALLVLLIFIAYPFVLGIWLSLTNKQVGLPSHFVG